MISNLGPYAHPKKATSKSRRPINLNPVTGPKQKSALPAPPNKPDPVSMNVMDVGMASATPGARTMPKGTIPPARIAAGPSGGATTAKKPAVKPPNKKTSTARASKPFFGSY